MAPPLATATRRMPSAEVATEVQLVTDVQLVTTVGPAADQVKRVPPQFVVPGGTVGGLITAANLVPSAHIATDVQRPPPNQARMSSPQFEVSEPLKYERQLPSSNTTNTSVFPSADVETPGKTMLTGPPPLRDIQVAPELVETARI